MTCYILAFGGNMDSPEKHIIKVLGEIASDEELTLVAFSSLYRSVAHVAPAAPDTQPDYVNAVAVVKTNWHPEDMLTWIHNAEFRHGRVRQTQWQARPLDIDIIDCDGIQYRSNRLTLPHPEREKRHFVLLPVQEIWHKVPDICRLNLKKALTVTSIDTCIKLKRIQL